MDVVGDIGSVLLFAQAEGGGEESGGGSFLVEPSLGLMIWTLLLFGATLVILNKLVFPRISDALERRSRAIEESIEHAERTKREADELLEEYRARLREARGQSEELLAATRRDIEAETRRALEEIRKEVADMTVLATEKITRKSLTPEDHRRLIEDALGEVDFSTLAGKEGSSN